MKNPKSILITGGSSGIGKALAIAYAAPGIIVSISGRNEDRLNETADLIKDSGAQCNAKVIDVTDTTAMKSWIEDIDKQAPIDLVIANAGIGSVPDATVHDNTTAIFDINVYGVFNTIHPALELMVNRERGQIAIVSSIASYLALPVSPPYSASKAAVRYYGKALRNKHAPDGIEVNVICPGWILTPMTEGRKDEIPFFASMENTVRLIQTGLKNNKGLIAFPRGFAFWVWWISTFPDMLQDFILRRMGK